MNNIERQFNLIAKEYDQNRRKFIPCFDDYYEQTTKFILANINTPQCVLDLGAGTGLLTYYWYQECSVEEEMSMLRRCSFSEVKCLYSYYKFSVIIAVK